MIFFQFTAVFLTCHSLYFYCAINSQDMKEPSYIMLNDKFARNRAMALQYLNDKQENIYDISMKLLFDKDAYIRALARSIIKQYKSDFNFRKIYLENIEPFGAPAILGLGETGQADDTEIIEKYLNDNRTALVRATLISLMKLKSEKYKTVITEKLMDSRIGVVKTAQKLFIKYNVADYNKVFEIFKETPYEYTKIKCTAILFKASKWERLIYMLEALSSTEESVVKLSLQFIQSWILGFNRSYIQASSQQKGEIQMLIEIQKEKLSSNLARELLFLLN